MTRACERMGFFDVQMESEALWCHICKRDTLHDRRKGNKTGLWTCRDKAHPHPTKEQQEAGMQLPQPTEADRMKRQAQLMKGVKIEVKK